MAQLLLARVVAFHFQRSGEASRYEVQLAKEGIAINDVISYCQPKMPGISEGTHSHHSPLGQAGVRSGTC